MDILKEWTMPFKNVMDTIMGGFHQKMRAVGITHVSPLSDEESFSERTLPVPDPKSNELLVQVLATSVNPVDVKMRSGYKEKGDFRIFGLDVVGRVMAMGQDVSGFTIGDRVYYAGKQQKQGADAEYQVIDYQMVAKAPESLSDSEAAAMPLTAITAHDILHHGFSLPVEKDAAKGQSLLVINGAGGVGSILIQLAKYMGLTVIATAGQKESTQWVRQMGADFVVNYHDDLPTQLADAGFHQVDYIANLQDTMTYWDAMVQLIRPYGRIAAIVGSTLPLELGELKPKSASFTWVFMLARGNNDLFLSEQGQMLQQMATLFDQGVLHSTVTKVYAGLSVDNVRLAFQDVASHHSLGKVVIDVATDGVEAKEGNKN